MRKQKYYKVVEVYKGRMFSVNGFRTEMEDIIKRQPRVQDSITVEYVKGKWVHRPRIGDDAYRRKLFVFNNIEVARRLKAARCGALLFECEVENPTLLWQSIVTVTALKLGKRTR